MRSAESHSWGKDAGSDGCLHIAACVAMVGFGANMVLLPSVIRDVRLARCGVSTQGLVTDTEMSFPQSRLLARSRESYRLHYKFQLGGRMFHGGTKVSRDRWLKAGAGLPIEVVYLPSDPDVNRIGDPIWRGTGMFVLVFVAGIDSVVVLVLLMGAVLLIRGIARVLAEGVPGHRTHW